MSTIPVRCLLTMLLHNPAKNLHFYLAEKYDLESLVAQNNDSEFLMASIGDSESLFGSEPSKMVTQIILQCKSAGQSCMRFSNSEGKRSQTSILASANSESSIFARIRAKRNGGQSFRTT